MLHHLTSEYLVKKLLKHGVQISEFLLKVRFVQLSCFEYHSVNINHGRKDTKCFCETNAIFPLFHCWLHC